MNISIDFGALNGLSERLKEFNPDTVLNDVAVNSLANISKRVHVDGLASDGSSIGSYSKPYMKVRTGNYPTPYYTKGKNKGGSRLNYNRSNDTKVILSLTREMENDMKVFKLPDGYGIGFSNSHNYDKAIWAENTYKKAIWELTEEEARSNNTLVEQAVNSVLNGQ